MSIMLVRKKKKSSLQLQNENTSIWLPSCQVGNDYFLIKMQLFGVHRKGARVKDDGTEAASSHQSRNGARVALSISFEEKHFTCRFSSLLKRSTLLHKVATSIPSVFLEFTKDHCYSSLSKGRSLLLRTAVTDSTQNYFVR